MSSNKAGGKGRRANAGNILDKDGGAPAAASTAAAAAARAQVFDALQAEMELADYARGVSGQKVKRVPRDQAISRTKKRKALRDADMVEMAIEVDDGDDDVEGGVLEDDAGGADATNGRRKRLRGSKVAFQDVVLKSMPLANNVTRSNDERNEMLKEVAELGIELDPEDDFDFEEGENDDDDQEDDITGGDDEDGEMQSSSDYNESGDEQDATEVAPSSQSNNRRKNVSVSKNGLIKRKTTKRVMPRLREFASQRLAEKHGEAIAAHVRGMSETAVQKLREVAKAAPGAPQVYSSLGMVYESMLTETEGLEVSSSMQGGEGEVKGKSRLDLLQRRMELAHKTYASYHVASLLTKRDFVLWERSGDAAMKVANIYSDIIDYMAKNPITNHDVQRDTTTTTRKQGFDPFAGAAKWRADQQEWMEHALSAYQSSDNLRPPGVDIPCKLAQVHISLGRYIDALSILTDLRNKASGKSTSPEQATQLRRSEMEGSYPCWLLYADLMMKIGFESKQWDEGICTNQNYMFKRWLRQNSKDFDWRERRLQALCLALEAAAGSASCVKLINWMRERAELYIVKNGKDGLDVELDDDDVDEADSDRAKKATEGENLVDTKVTHEEEREKLLTIHKVELQKFDRLSNEMKLIAESPIYNSRMAARAALLENHRAAMKELAMKKYAKEQQKITTLENDASENKSVPTSLPLQGSCATVYDIASLLLKQCVELKCFDGGLLVVQSVLDYSRERVSRYERKSESEQEIAKVNNARQGLVQPTFKYDQINFESDNSDDEGFGTYVSDDECLEQRGTLQMLKSGSLPLDLKALHSVCLLGVGGQDFVALMNLEQIIISSDMALFNDDDVLPDVSIGNDPQWLAFSTYFKSPVNKSFLLASVALLVMEKSGDYSRSKRVLDIFMKHLRAVDNSSGKNNGLDESLAKSSGLDRAHTLSFLLALLTLTVYCARADLGALSGAGTEEVKLAEVAANDSLYALQTMLRFKSAFWSPRYSDWSLPKASMEMVSILSGALANIVQAASFGRDRYLISVVKAGSMKARHLISTISHADGAPSKSVHAIAETWRTFPLPFNWQSSFHEKVSLRTFNLCVACCVSAFSGWEPSEFNLDQLRSSDGNMFGVTLEGPTVAGFLPNNVASSVAEQWGYISSILPNLETLPFQVHLEERTQMDWYQRVMRNIGKLSDKCKIAFYGEEDGIQALLSFSMLCLLAAKESNGDERDEFLKNSFSVLLPMTQFCIDKQVWQSKIGTAAISYKNESQVSYYLDEHSTWRGPTKTTQVQMPKPPIKPVRLPQPTKVAIPSRRRSQLTTIEKIRISDLYYLWMNHSTPGECRVAVLGAQLAMKKVDDSMKNLRKSRTLNSLERSSIDVSAALVDLAAYDECDNPLVCLQHASMFAGLGSKRGNNDEPFKRFLPLKDKCSPLEALNILGRADCLRAIHFLHEAQYLCTWIASVCRIHRVRQNADLPWSSSRWRVIGIVTYIVSSTLDETSEALSLDNPEITLRKWDGNTLEELERGKSDALVLVGNLTQANHTNAPTRAGLQSNSNGHDRRYLEGTLDSGNKYPYYSEQVSQEFDVENVDVEEDGDDPYSGVQVVGI